MEQSILAIKAEQKRTEDARTTCVSESANYAISATDLLHLDRRGPLAGGVRRIKFFCDYAVEVTADRRAMLEEFARENFKTKSALRLSPATTNLATAKKWFAKGQPLPAGISSTERASIGGNGGFKSILSSIFGARVWAVAFR